MKLFPDKKSTCFSIIQFGMIAVCTLCSLPAFGQKDTTLSKVYEPHKYQNEVIDPEILSGVWESVDSTHSRICFTYHHGSFILKGDTSTGNPASIRIYSFFISSTGPFVKAHGYSAAWPPFYCYIHPVKGDTITVDHGNIVYEAQRTRFVRVPESN